MDGSTSCKGQRSTLERSGWTPGGLLVGYLTGDLHDPPPEQRVPPQDPQSLHPLQSSPHNSVCSGEGSGWAAY